MICVGAYEAKTHFAELLERVMAGEQVVITRHRHPVARLVPETGSRRQPVAETIAAMREFRRGRQASPAEIAAMVQEGRR